MKKYFLKNKKQNTVALPGSAFSTAKLLKGLPGSAFRTRKTTTGFTLIEMMVSVSIFAIVVMISMTAILTVVDASKKAQSMKSVMNNLNFALETMTRTIKTGSGMSGTASSLTLTDAENITVVYKLENGRILRDETPITAPEVVVDRLQFDVMSNQPSVVMIIRGKVNANSRVSSEFNIQTTVTQRIPGV